jgi:putative Ca2+/H+ antiporter (TMEM165/GDT1 family)
MFTVEPYARFALLISLIAAHFRCRFIKTASSVVPHTFITLLLTQPVLQSVFIQNFLVLVFWVAMPCELVDGFQHSSMPPTTGHRVATGKTKSDIFTAM